MSTITTGPATTDRERDFWDHHVPSLDECLQEFHEFHAGPGPFDRAMMDAIDPAPGRRILDFACGAGITTAWLAARGADVVGIDLSPASIRRAEELRDRLGLSYELRVGDVDALPTNGDAAFDGVVGRFALHHLDLQEYVPALADVLRPNGKAAFVETMATNPVLRIARRRLPGRLGVSRLGTNDEHPLRREDLSLLGKTFGTLDVRVPQVVFFTLVDRHVLKGRRPAMRKLLYRSDQVLARSERLKKLSYMQVIVLERNEPHRVIDVRPTSER